MFHLKYRADIDGLRAVAILAVVGYHAFPRWIHGGYVGVDVFFVISGYLISAILFSNFDRGSFSYLDFYSRRIKRIFPALCLLFLALMVLGYFLLFAGEYRELGKYVAAGAAFVTNFALWKEAGYFDTAAINKPLLHLWSLAIEEQFYLVWPLVVGLAWSGRVRFTTLVSVVGVLSLGLNFFLIYRDPVGDFYSPLARFWELMLGGNLSYLVRHRSGETRQLRNLESIGGTVLIVASILFFDDKLAFPGFWALLPTIGAALVISAGQDAWINRLILSHPLMRWIGLISYPLYLWHWPLLSIGNMYNISKGPGKALLMVLAVLLAWLTYQFFEKPLRWSRSNVVPILLLCCVAGLGAIGYLAYAGAIAAPVNAVYTKLERVQTEITKDDYPGAPFDGRSIKPVMLHGETDKVVLFSGDSHMDQYYPAVKALYDHGGRKPSYSAEFVSHPHCLPSPNSALTSSNESNPNFSCNDLFAQVMKIASAPSTRKVVFGGNWWLSPGYTDGALRSFGEAIRKLKAQGKQVFVVLDNPQGDEFDPLVIMRMNRLNAYFGNGQNIATGDRAVPSDKVAAESEARQMEFRKIAAQNGALIIDPYSYLCPHKQCPVLIDGEPTHRDTNHLRPFYVRKFGAAMFRDIVFAEPQ